MRLTHFIGGLQTKFSKIGYSTCIYNSVQQTTHIGLDSIDQPVNGLASMNSWTLAAVAKRDKYDLMLPSGPVAT